MKSEFKVIEIIDANTIRVIPSWKFKEPWDPAATSGDIVKLKGFDGIAASDDYAKNRLVKLLLNERIMLFKPELIVSDKSGENEVACNVMLDETDVSHFFPDFRPAIKTSWWQVLGF